MNSLSLGESRSDSLGMSHWGNDAEYIGTVSADEEAGWNRFERTWELLEVGQRRSMLALALAE